MLRKEELELGNVFRLTTIPELCDGWNATGLFLLTDKKKFGGCKPGWFCVFESIEKDITFHIRISKDLQTCWFRGTSSYLDVTYIQ